MRVVGHEDQRLRVGAPGALLRFEIFVHVLQVRHFFRIGSDIPLFVVASPNFVDTLSCANLERSFNSRHPR